MKHLGRSVALVLALALVAAGTPLLGDAAAVHSHCPMAATATAAHDCCPEPLAFSRPTTCCPAHGVPATVPSGAALAATNIAPVSAVAELDATPAVVEGRPAYDAASVIAGHRHEVGLFTLHSVYLI